MLWDAHRRFMEENQNPDCFSIAVELKDDTVDISYLRLTVDVEVGPEYFEIRPVCEEARSVTFHYDSSGTFLGRQWNR